MCVMKAKVMITSKCNNNNNINILETCPLLRIYYNTIRRGYYTGIISNLTRIDGTSTINAIAKGNIPVHLKYISWSYRNRGIVARVQTKKNINKQDFKPRIIAWILINVSFSITSGKLYPPKNRIAANVDINTIEQYSPRKKNTKIIPECSVKNPATSSDSASGRSKGVRLHSANIAIKKIMNTGNRGTTYQIPCCLSIIPVILNVPLSNNTVKIAALNTNS
uniref:Uncharacterized protein n=1 Tax=Apiotrichum gracile TaxID=82516 RepID=A0A8K1ZR57_9TREE